ncbi:MAG: hypothetical protein WCK34_07025 [Bacteroidota bacterium]
MLTQLRLQQLYAYLESVAMKGIPVSRSEHYPEILKITRQILETFGIPLSRKHEALLIQYVYNADDTDQFMDDVLTYLTRMAEKKLTGRIGDFLPSKPGDQQEEEDDDMTDEFEEEFESEEELEWQRIEEQREKRIRALQSMPRTVEPMAVKQYLDDHLDFQLTDREFEDIESGFRLFWKYANPQMAGDLNFQYAVDQYLTAIESRMDREKMALVVDSILEYLQEIRLWGYPE